MREFATELRASLADAGSSDTDATFIAPSLVLRESAPHRARARRAGWPLYLLLAALGAAAVVAGVLVFGGSKGAKSGAPPSSTGAVLALHGVGAYDPVGGDGEHDAEAPNATDRNPSTFWQTEHYRSGLRKNGVGVVLDAGSSVAAKRVTITSDTPGFTATILAGNAPSGPFAADAPSQQVGASATFALQGHAARYYVVWITDLGTNGSVHVNEVTATS